MANWHCGHFWYVLEDSPEKAMAPHSSTLAWKIPWMEEPRRLQSMGLLRVWHDWATSLSFFTFMHWRRKWQPTPVFLPGESQGQRRLSSMGSPRVGHNWYDFAAAAAGDSSQCNQFVFLRFEVSLAFSGGNSVKNSSANAGDVRGMGSIPGSWRCPGRGHGNPLSYSCLENPMNRGGWRATVHGAAKSQTWLTAEQQLQQKHVVIKKWDLGFFKTHTHTHKYIYN